MFSSSSNSVLINRVSAILHFHIRQRFSMKRIETLYVSIPSGYGGRRYATLSDRSIHIDTTFGTTKAQSAKAKRL